MNWLLTYQLTQWNLWVDVTSTVKYVGLLSNMDFYAPRRWRIPTATPLTCILYFCSVTLTWQHIQILHGLAYFWGCYRCFCNFSLIYDNQCKYNFFTILVLEQWYFCKHQGSRGVSKMKISNQMIWICHKNYKNCLYHFCKLSVFQELEL